MQYSLTAKCYTCIFVFLQDLIKFGTLVVCNRTSFCYVISKAKLQDSQNSVKELHGLNLFLNKFEVKKSMLTLDCCHCTVDTQALKRGWWCSKLKVLYYFNVVFCFSQALLLKRFLFNKTQSMNLFYFILNPN